MSDTKKTILMVEDEPSYQHTLAEKLGVEGFDVLTAKNGEDGLAVALEKHPDLVLLDIVMQKMDGIEMAKNLRSDEYGKEAKIVILTNLSDTNKLEQALDNKIFNYFIKTDVSIDILMQKVKDIIYG